MRKIDIKKLFPRLCGLEYELLKYINRIQGEASAPIDFYAAAEALSMNKDVVRTAIRRLVKAEILIAEGEKFQINKEVYKSEE